MNRLMLVFAAVVVIAAALAGIAIWAPRRLGVKISALVLAALLMSAAYLGLVDLLGRPKPATMEWAAGAVTEATVLGAIVDEDRAIYLWLRFDESPEPRAYMLPWNMATARQLHEAMRQGQARGTTVRMRRPFESEAEADEPLFYAEPQPSLPPKTLFAG